MTVSGTLSDGRQTNLTSSSNGTAYQSSNPAIATVSADGLVTAVSSGTVFITATNESVAGTLRLQVQLSGDSDGDGIPDDYERANAVNPGGRNVATLPGVVVSASSSAPGSSASLAVDRNLRTSWLAAPGNAANLGNPPFLDVTLPTDQNLAQVRLLGNRFAGYSILAGIVQAFDAAGNEVFNSGTVPFPTSGSSVLDLAVPVDKDGIRRVRFTSTADQGNSPGLAEIQLLSRPGGPGFDLHNPADANADFDGDGLSNLEEYRLGTNPFSADTDGDGLTDGQEIALGTNPLSADTDGDGLTDGQEVLVFGTNPRVADTDGDGLPDGVEVRLGLNPLAVDSDGNGIPDGSEDTDNDGLSNLEELRAHTDPGNPDTDGDGILDGLDPDPLRPERTPPTVTLTTPAAGATLYQGQLLDLTADAQDDGIVRQVELLVDGVVVGSSTTAPYTVRYIVPFVTHPLTFGARATDGAGNVGNATPVTVRVAPPVALTFPAAGATVFQGQTLDLTAEVRAAGIQQVDFFVNGAPVGTATSTPYTVRFSIPYATDALTFGAQSTDAFGNVATAAPVPVTVVPALDTTVVGTFVDAAGNPIPGATVSLRLHGLLGEFFDFRQPLTEIPDLTGLTPSLTKWISGPAFRNPSGLLSPDTFGVSLAPDFAGRFTGTIEPPFPGLYEIRLGAADGARVRVGGSPILEVSGGSGFTEVAGFVDLSAGPAPIEVDSFAGSSPAELQIGPAGSFEILLAADRFKTVTGPDGSFSFSGVPSHLGDVGADVFVNLGGLTRSARAVPAPPVAGGVTRLGTIALVPTACFTGTLTYFDCLTGPVSDTIQLFTLDDQGHQVLVGSVTPDASGRFCATVPTGVSSFFFREDNLTCDGKVSYCQTSYLSTGGASPGTCGDDPDTCSNLGDLLFYCNFSPTQ